MLFEGSTNIGERTHNEAAYEKPFFDVLLLTTPQRKHRPDAEETNNGFE
jgi:hypothetical protein